MFSKKLQPALSSPAAASGSGIAARVVRNPYIGAGAAAGLLAIAVTSLVLVGDPGAGAPKVRVALSQAPGEEASGWREGMTADQVPAAPAAAEDPLLAALDPSTTSEGPGPGEAIIHLPNGERQRIATSGGPAASGGLAPAPFAGMTQQGPGGLLPVIAADGRTPATAYARPFTANGKPKVALVIGGLGLQASTTRQAIENLPPEVTLSFAVNSDNLQGWIDLARRYGHEVLLETPLEPIDYPQNDPGPLTLRANARPEEMAKILDGILAKATGYFGVTNYMGSRFVTSTPAMTGFAAALKRRGLAFVDDGSAVGRGSGIPRASAYAVIDEQPAPATIAGRLSALETAAGQKGQALGSGFAYPVTVQQVALWARGLTSRGYQLAPASALTARR